MVVNKIGLMMQSVMQGIMVVGFSKQNLNIKKPETNEFMRLDFYEKLEDAMKYVYYETKKCDWAQ